MTTDSWSRSPIKSNKERAARGRAKLKCDVLNGYGAKCICCGETEPLFLTIDHIDGGGGEHRRSVGLRGSAFYRWLRQQGYPSGFQCMCFNCNFAKWANGECPHRSNDAK